MSFVARGQKHQNTTAWVPDRADKHNSLRKLIEQLPNDGVCQRCHDQIEWKKSYGKYKPLRQPGKCTGCGNKTVQLAYHVICGQCAHAKNACAKCQAPLPPQNETVDPKTRLPSTEEMREMTERERRAAIRKIEKAQAKEKKAELENEEMGDEPEAAGQDPGDEAVQAAKRAADAARIAHAAAREEARMQAMAMHEPVALPTVSAPPAAAAPSSAQAAGNRPQPTPPLHKPSAPKPYVELDDDAAVDAVEAENVTDDEEDGDEQEGEDDGEENYEDDDEEDDDGADEEEDDDEESLREAVANLAHSEGAAVLVLQAYPWIRPVAHFPLIEAGFDALVERLGEAGGSSAAAADAMSDRVAAVFERAGEGSAAAAVAMLIELECWARVLPASFAADASVSEQEARALFTNRGAQLEIR